MLFCQQRILGWSLHYVSTNSESTGRQNVVAVPGLCHGVCKGTFPERLVALLYVVLSWKYFHYRWPFVSLEEKVHLMRHLVLLQENSDSCHLPILKHIWVFAPRFGVLHFSRNTWKGVYLDVWGKECGGNTKLFAWISLSLAPCSIQWVGWLPL